MVGFMQNTACRKICNIKLKLLALNILSSGKDTHLSFHNLKETRK